MRKNPRNTSGYLQLSAGVANSLINGNDMAIKVVQDTYDILFTPLVGYYHKGGPGVSFPGYLSKENQAMKLYPYSVPPAYEYNRSKAVNASVSYTYYFIEDIYDVVSSPIQNDFFGSFFLKKPFLHPGISAGYSSRKSDEIIKIDTVLKIQNQKRRIKYTDTVNILLKSYPLTFNLRYDFNFFDLFSQKDGLSFTPEILLNAGINIYKVRNNSSMSDFNAFIKKEIKKNQAFFDSV